MKLEIDPKNNFNLFKEFIDRNERIIEKFPEIHSSCWCVNGTRKVFTFKIGDCTISHFIYDSDTEVEITWGKLYYETSWGNTVVNIRIDYSSRQLFVTQLEEITDEMIETFYSKQVEIVKEREKKQKELTIKNKLKTIDKEFRKPKDAT